MKILFYGDIVGRVGRNAVHLSLNRLKTEYGVDFVIANAENASHGRGLTKKNYHDLVSYGCDALTLGNHWADKVEIEDYIDHADRLIRPLNLVSFSKGVGSKVFMCGDTPIRVTNILGTGFMKEEVASPYTSFATLLLDSKPCIHIVDYHAESTSEKITFAHFFDGKATLFVGTHTHVQTADMRILEKGSAFMTDVGMTGDPDGVIGFSKESVIGKVVMGDHRPFALDKDARMMVNALIVEVDEKSYRAISLKPLNFIVEGEYEESLDN